MRGSRQIFTICTFDAAYPYAQAKRRMGRVMQLASFSLAEVTYATGANSIAYLVQEQAKSASFRVKARSDNVSGVILPAFESDRTAGSGAFSFRDSLFSNTAGARQYL